MTARYLLGIQTVDETKNTLGVQISSGTILNLLPALAELRTQSLMQGEMGVAVELSHVIAMLQLMLEGKTQADLESFLGQ